MINKDLSIDFAGVHFENPFCLSASPVGNCYEMCARAYRAGWGGITFKTISPNDERIDEVSPRFNEMSKKIHHLLPLTIWNSYLNGQLNKTALT